jgi:ribonuclease P protein component
VKAGWDVVFIARRGTGEAKYRQLESAAQQLMRRTRLITIDSVSERPG